MCEFIFYVLCGVLYYINFMVLRVINQYLMKFPLLTGQCTCSHIARVLSVSLCTVLLCLPGFCYLPRALYFTFLLFYFSIFHFHSISLLLYFSFTIIHFHYNSLSLYFTFTIFHVHYISLSHDFTNSLSILVFSLQVSLTFHFEIAGLVFEAALRIIHLQCFTTRLWFSSPCYVRIVCFSTFSL